MKNPARSTIAIICLALIGCGESYVLLPGRFTLESANDITLDAVLTQSRQYLLREGFEDLARDEEMIALLESSKREVQSTAYLVALLERQYTFLNKNRGLRITVTDYTDRPADLPTLAYEAPAQSFIEVAVYHERPGGFGPAGHAIFLNYKTFLETSLGQPAVVVTPPPPTDDDEFKRVTDRNRVTGIVSWVASAGLALIVTGPLSLLLIKRVSHQPLVRRCLFVLINAWLVAPVPLPVATLYVVPLPNLFAAPWSDIGYYKSIWPYPLYSFLLATLLCTLASLPLFRERRALASAA